MAQECVLMDPKAGNLVGMLRNLLHSTHRFLLAGPDGSWALPSTIIQVHKPFSIKIETGTEEDYYINFNRKTGMNSETQEGGDQVLITSQGANGRAFAKSTLHAKLSAGGSYEMKGFGGSDFGGIKIKVNAINLSASPAYASVTIGSEQEMVLLNCGGDDYNDGSNVWKADAAYVDGGNIYSTDTSISSTTEPELYRYVQENSTRSYFATELVFSLFLPCPLLLSSGVNATAQT